MYTKARPYYNRTRSADNVPQTHAGRPVANVNMAAKPIDPSSQSKKKLKSFAFVDGAPQEPNTSTNKENEANARPQQSAEKVNKQASKGSQVAELPAAHETASSKTLPPSTPVTRLPLADLIGNNETQKRSTLLLGTPEEDLQWQAGPTPDGALSRKRKRTRSSSPATSSQNEASNFFPNSRATNKTPQHDDAVRTWSRATAVDTAKVTPDAKQAAEFAHLIERSSPHSSATAGSVSGLRRWASCGVEFPSATKPKKRRTAGAFRDGRNASGRGTPVEEDGPSKVGRLLERIQETLAQPVKDAPPAAPSSSSPLPEAGRFDQADEVSPLHRMPKDEELRTEERAPDDSPSGRVAAKLHIRGSSEFGDDDLDLDMVQDFDTRGVQSAVLITKRKDISGFADDGIDLDVDEANVSAAADKTVQSLDLKPAQQTRKNADHHDHAIDEFDVEDDFLADDLEIVASMYDTRDDTNHATSSIHRGLQQPQHEALPHSDTSDALLEAADLVEGSMPLPAPKPAPVNVITVDSDDDFGGDDLDTDDLVAAEAIATQRAASGSQSQSHV